LDFLLDRVYRMFQHLLVAGLAVMSLMVLANVFLRYFFDSGIVFTEEVGRYIYVWLTFLGSIVALRKGTHLGMDSVIRRMPHPVRVVFFALSHFLMLGCCVLLWIGCWTQATVNLSNFSPVSGMPVAFLYGSGLVTAVLMGITLLGNLWKLATGQLSSEQLVAVTESEDRPHGAN
jgi:TRAP-type C4-dicarboxylate transport system permease small subunit